MARSRDECEPAGAERILWGGSEVLVVETLVFNDTQITSPTNGNNPQWGGAATHCLRQTDLQSLSFDNGRKQ